MLIASASACTVGSILLPPYQCRLWRVDAEELRRRRHMDMVLQNNTRPLAGDALPEDSSPDAHLVG
ncbi:hypothetical protein ABZ858_33640 [Streptomyces sp. NPDC047017]|uniref:hypothetical protein n=1 Tax=Streptomyces sp. NPDC047017 TaxID=3155024 RepID=UPI003402A760